MLFFCQVAGGKEKFEYLVNLNKGGILILCYSTQSPFKVFIVDLFHHRGITKQMCFRIHVREVCITRPSSKVWRNPRVSNGGPLTEGGVFTVYFHKWWWANHVGISAKTLQKGKIKSRKVKHHMKRESLWWYLNFFKEHTKGKKKYF